MDESTDRPSYEPEPQPTTAEEPTARLGSLQRLWMSFFSPGEVFADIKIKPTWILCLVVLVALGVAAQFVIMPHLDTEATLRARLADSGAEMSDQQIEQMVEMGEKFAMFGPIVALVIGPLMYAILAAVFFVLLKIVGSVADYKQAFSTTLHAYWPPTVVNMVLMAILIQRIGMVTESELRDIVKSHLGVFLSPDAPAWLSAAASTVSVFNIWTVVLLVIGFAAVGGISKGRAGIAALVPWVVYILGKAGFSALSA
jgi:hypothetical protein